MEILLKTNWFYRCFARKMNPVRVEPKKRNIEIKARIANDAGYEKRVDIAKFITKTTGKVLEQRDVFYNVPNGRLKLRVQVTIKIWFHI